MSQISVEITGGISVTESANDITVDASSTPITVESVSGTVQAVSPITNTGTGSSAVIGIDQAGLTLTQSQITGLVAALAGKASTTHASTHTSAGSDPLTLTIGQITSLGSLLDQKVDGTYDELTNIWSTGPVITRSFSNTTPSLQVRRNSSSSTANIQEWETETGTVLASISPSGVFAASQASITGTAAGSVPITITGASGQTAALTEWKNNAGTLLGSMSSGGVFYAAGNGTFGTATSLARITAQIGTATNIGLIVKGAASQSADLQQWQNSSGSILGKVDQNGFAVFGGGTVLSNSVLSVNIYGTTQVGATIRGTSGQTADLQQWQTSGGTVAGRIKADGTPTFSWGLYYGTQTLNADGDAVVPLAVKPFSATQSADLTQWRNSSNSTIAYVTATGRISGIAVSTWNNYAYNGEEQSGGFLRLNKATAALANPAASQAKIYLRDGTNAGTLKLVIRAGAAGAETTILDNIPQ